jgi:hypothetical protein
VSYAERGTGTVPEPQTVVDALRTWLDPQTIGHFPRTLIDALLAAEHLEMWSILAWECDWWGAAPLARSAGALSAGE